MQAYFPTHDDWQTRDPADAGLNPQALTDAVTFARDEAETSWPYDLAEGLNSGREQSEPPPWNEILGPTRARNGPNGLILRGGYIVAEWGDTTRSDMTFSIAKSYLAVLVGLALEQGLIRSVDDPVREYVLDAGFEAPHNRNIRWHHLLQQTSEWEGSLWDKPDLVDRNRQVGPGADNSKKGTYRELRTPGTFWEYNDVRVNRLAFSLMQVFRRPLPEVLKQYVMDPIGASDGWHWHGYRNSYFEIDGKVMQSVPGGSHWGGGIWINSRDQARFGLLLAQRGFWQDRQILPAGWIEKLTTPCPIMPVYGYLFWLNSGRRLYPSAPETSFFAIGAGSNIIWIDTELDLVAVVRWIDQAEVNAFCGKVMESLV
jgi:hypothetical protein